MLVTLSAVVTFRALNASVDTSLNLFGLVSTSLALLGRSGQANLVTVGTDGTGPLFVVTNTGRVTEVAYWARDAVLKISHLLLGLVSTCSAWSWFCRDCTTVVTNRTRPRHRIILDAVESCFAWSTILITLCSSSWVVPAFIAANR